MVGATLDNHVAYFIHYDQAYPDKVAWSQQVVDTLIHATPLPIVAQRIWPPVDSAD